jgi:PTS system fructose-specific IIA component
VLLDVAVSSKEALFEFLSNTLYEMGRITSASDFKSALNKRENEVTTGIGEGIAIPHSKDISVIFPTLLYVRLKEPIEYEALDQKLVKEIFLIAMPNSYQKEHLTLLAQIASMLQDSKTKFFKLKSKQSLFEFIDKAIQQP